MAARVPTDDVAPAVEEGPGPSRELVVTRQELIHCALPSWYDHFKDVTIPSVFISLPAEFVSYLNSDGPLVLPQGCDLPGHASPSNSDSDSDTENKVDWDDDDKATDCEAPEFPELLQRITTAIQSLGGTVYPKLNWSSPRDASWISPSNSLCCSCPAEVILLLKSSDFISHDLSRAFEYCKEEPEHSLDSFTYTLCLRRWVSIHPSSEFRCFVQENKLIGISQRSHTSCYPHLLSGRDVIRTEVVEFFQNKIRAHFPNRNYVFDVFKHSDGKIQLVDFNPYCPMTDGLLFDWEELAQGRLLSDSQELPELRCVDSETSIQPSYLHDSRLPKDIIDLSTGEDISKFADLFHTGENSCNEYH